MQELEREKNGMVSRIRDLEALLVERGVEVRAWQGPSAVDESSNGTDAKEVKEEAEPSTKEGWEQFRDVWFRSNSTSAPDLSSDSKNSKTAIAPATIPAGVNFVPSFPRSELPPRPDGKFVGPGQDNAPFNSMGGTRLSVFGASIDVAAFNSPDLDEKPTNAGESTPLYNKSEQALLQSMMGRNPRLEVDLPPRADAFTYAEYYFTSVGIFGPILHKPSFMRLVSPSSR
jgi:hypothetical protein